MSGRANGAGQAGSKGATPPHRLNGGKGTVRRAIAEAAPVAAPQATIPFGFEMRDNGLWRLPGEGKAPFRVCG
ncbi:MAG: hypothetical protein NT133_06950, partial [Alphaproteobacteria bacterium]|nr:hypothetical protein [Alphaproteobacteria bacterium]